MASEMVALRTRFERAKSNGYTSLMRACKKQSEELYAELDEALVNRINSMAPNFG